VVFGEKIHIVIFPGSFETAFAGAGMIVGSFPGVQNISRPTNF
jgi:hypothetical protein